MTIEAVFDEAASGKAESKRPYAEYRDVGAVWLGLIPKHWQVMPLKFAVTFQRGHDLPLDERTEGEFPIVTSAGLSGTHNRPAARAPGIVTGRYGTIGAFYIMERDYWPLNTTLYSVHLRGNRPRFLWYMLQNVADIFVLHSLKSAVPGVDRNDLHPTLVAVPPLAEQQAIAAFLDRETAKIDALVEKKRRLIELLKEKRAALISHAVTKGLNPDVPMKDSGVGWLGQIPEDWRFGTLRYFASLQTGLTLGKRHEDGVELVTRPYLRVANVQDGYLDLTEITEVEIPPDEVCRYELKTGDVLLTEGGDFDKLGRGYVWDGQIEGCLHQNHIFAVRPDARVLDSYYLAALMSSSHGKHYFTSTASQTTNLASTNSTKLKAFPVLLPPKDVQQDILRQLGRIGRNLDALAEKFRDAIDRLLEYRTALISAAVTGKIDVRGEA